MDLRSIPYITDIDQHRTTFVFAAAAAAIAAILISLEFLTDGYIVLLILAVAAIIPLFIKYPRIWLYTLALSTVLYFRSSDNDLSVMDIVIGIFYVGGLFVWFVWTLLIKKQKIIRNIADWMLLFFFIFLFSNLIIAYLNDVIILNWFRIYGLRVLVLYYFPIRTYFTKKDEIIKFLAVFGIAIFLTDCSMLYDYYQNSYKVIVYAYQIAASPRQGETLFSTTSISLLVFLFLQKERLNKLIMLVFFAVTLLALVSTFARAFWLMFFIMVLIFFFFLERKDKIRMLLTGIITLGLLAITIFTFFPSSVSIVFKVIETKIVSSTIGTKDLSVLGRVYEAKGIIKWVELYPLGGNGMGKAFSYFNPIELLTVTKPYCHNGYIYNTYMVGLPLFLFFLIPLVYYALNSLFLIRKGKDPFNRSLLLSTFFILTILLVNNNVGHIMGDRDAQFIMALALAMHGFATRRAATNEHDQGDQGDQISISAPSTLCGAAADDQLAGRQQI